MTRTLSEMSSDVQSRSGRVGWDTEIKSFIASRYVQVLHHSNWNEITNKVSWSATVNPMGLPQDIDTIMRVYDDSDYDIDYERLGDKPYFLPEPAAGAQNGVYILSSDAADTTQTIRVKAIRRLLGYESQMFSDEGSVILSGSSWVTPSFISGGYDVRWADVSEVSKSDDTAGVVTFWGGATVGADNWAFLGPKDRSVSYPWIGLSTNSALPATINIEYRREVQRLVNDDDVPMLKCEDLLVEGAMVDVLKRGGQYAKAQSQERKWLMQLQEFAFDRLNEGRRNANSFTVDVADHR